MIASRIALHLALVMFVADALSACARPDPEVASSAVPDPQAFLARIRPADLGRDVDAVQLVSVSRESNALAIEVRLSVRAEEVRFAAQDAIGQRLMTVRWSGEEVSEERSPNLPVFIRPKGLLADLVAICWPEAVVRRALEASGSTLTVKNDERVILVGGRETMRATRDWTPDAPWTGRLRYFNIRAGYAVAVQSVEQR